jgi:hypothetical protein
MPTMLPTWTAEASIYHRSRYSYCAPSTAFSSAWAQNLGLLGQVTPDWGLPCGTCGPCLQDNGGCSKTCWTHAPPHGTCDEVDLPCHGCTITCAPGETQCGTQCVNLINNPGGNAPCGTCTQFCDANEICLGGLCSCAPGASLCGHTCCAPGSTCCNGACCAPGSTCCNGTCCPSGLCCGGSCCGSGSVCCTGSDGSAVCGGPCPSGLCCPPPYTHCRTIFGSEVCLPF